MPNVLLNMGNTGVCSCFLIDSFYKRKTGAERKLPFWHRFFVCSGRMDPVYFRMLIIS